ncbi:hypothetical protein BC826DRAFT_507533 [Russula brevipes]|nr:hypothetical protein BC826DRAFT_507533 [Russula brevipes]
MHILESKSLSVALKCPGGLEQMSTDSSCRPSLSRSPPPPRFPRVAGAPGTTNFRRGQSSARLILIGIGLAPGKDSSWWHRQLPALSFVVGGRLAHNDACTLGYAVRPCFLRRSVSSGCIPFFTRIVALPVSKITRFIYFASTSPFVLQRKGSVPCRVLGLVRGLFSSWHYYECRVQGALRRLLPTRRCHGYNVQLTHM